LDRRLDTHASTIDNCPVLLWLDRLRHDLTHTARMVARAPAFALIAVVSIAFGTGANIAIFSTADAMLLRPLPVPDWSDLVTVGTRVRREVSSFNVSSYQDFADVRARTRSFTDLAAFTSTLMGFSAAPGAPAQVKLATVVTHNYFRVMGVEPALGRAFLPDDDEEGRPPTVVLSHRLWQSMFAGDPDVLARTVRVAGIDCAIVGVAPEAFWGLNQRYIPEAAFLPIGLWPRLTRTPTGLNPLTSRDFDGLIVKGRLRPGITLSDAQSELTVVAADLARIYPATNRNQALVVQTELEVKAAADPFSTGALLLLSTLSLAVLAVACANVSGLLASRAPVRAREIALRLAIGAGRARLFRQLMTESVAVALAGAFGGLLVGWAGVALLNQIRYPSEVVAMPRAYIDARAMTMALVLAIASAVFFGLVPAWQATRTNLVQPLKAGDAAPGRLRLTGRHVLVTLQVSLSMVLVTIAIFTSQAFQAIFGEGPGFRTTNLAKLTVDPGQAGHPSNLSAGYFERVLNSARAAPGVTFAGATSGMPLFSGEMAPVVPEGVSLPEGQSRVQVVASRIDEQYFAAMDIAMLSGRAFDPTDGPSAARVAIVNDTFARRFWPNADAIGKRVQRADLGDQWITIVGVVRTSKYWFPGENPQPAIYFPYRQDVPGRMAVLIAVRGDSRSYLAPLGDLVRAADPDVPVYDVQTIEDYYDARATSFGNVLLRLVGGMGVMGMILTMSGLYGLVSYAANRRTREIGIRLAIGASQGRVLRMVLRQGMAPAVAGVVLGSALSLAAARLLGANVPIHYDYRPVALLAIVPALVLVTAAAAFLPARRASRVAPTIALRCE
jgi:predicted permease